MSTSKRCLAVAVIALLLAATSLGEAGCGDSHSSATADADTDTDSDSDTDADSDSDTDTESDTESESSSDTDSETPLIPLTCEDAMTERTSLGCEFFAADLDNWTMADSEVFAIVVANPHDDQSAEVIVTHGIEGPIFDETLAPGELRTIEAACGNSECLVDQQEIEEQGIAAGAGFRVTSDVPIQTYQWNPYYSDLYSTDASLLIPVSSLDGTYIVAAWNWGPGSTWPYLRSQVTVIATEDDTQVTFVPSADVAASGGIGPFTAGAESEAIALDAHDVLSIEAGTPDADLTGTVVQADKPIAVFGGHACGNVPSTDYEACDHLEEQMIPLAAWGSSAVLARPSPRPPCTAAEDPVLYRIIAGADDMTVTFDPPPVAVGGSHSFASRGEVLEFLGALDFYVEGTLDDPPDPEEPEAPLLAYQLMTGTGHAPCADGLGDPMMLLSAPAGQYLDTYVFSTDTIVDFDYDEIIITRPAGTEVTLDCAGVLGDEVFTPVGTSGFEVGRFYIDDPDSTSGCEDGTHLLTAMDNVGLAVVGVSGAVSYGYLGGVGIQNLSDF